MISVTTAIFIGIFIGLVMGVILGAFVLKRFNVTDYSISGRNRAKKGGVINFKPNMDTSKKQRKGIFKRKNK